MSQDPSAAAEPGRSETGRQDQPTMPSMSGGPSPGEPAAEPQTASQGPQPPGAVRSRYRGLKQAGIAAAVALAAFAGSYALSGRGGGLPSDLPEPPASSAATLVDASATPSD